MTFTSRIGAWVLVLAVGVWASPAAAQGPRAGTRLIGSGPLGLGVDVAPLAEGLGHAGPSSVSAVSLDLDLRWPVVADEGATPLLRRIEPRLAVGPALLVASDRGEIVRLAETRGPVADNAVSLGVRGGAGVSLAIGKSTSLFGDYGITRVTDVLPRGAGRSSLGADSLAHDVVYGLTIRF